MENEKLEKEIINYFKDKNIKEADKLLLETALNNYKLGMIQGKKELIKELLDKKYKQLYNANTILLLNKFKEKLK